MGHKCPRCEAESDRLRRLTDKEFRAEVAQLIRTSGAHLERAAVILAVTVDPTAPVPYDHPFNGHIKDWR